MNSTKEVQQLQNEFLEEIANHYGFSRKRRDVFIQRFHANNKLRENQELAESVYRDKDTVVWGQSFQYHLNEICKELEKNGCQIHSLSQQGRPRKGESPWEQAFNWLWEIKFPEWRSQQGTSVKSWGEVVDVPVASHFYIERDPDESQCYEALLQPGALIRIKAPQQMGKTWLMEKLLEKVALQGYRTINLSLKLADSRIHFTNLDKLLRWLCTNVSRQLGLPSQLDEYWDEEGIGSKVSCTTYFEEYLLAQTETPLVLGLDDVDWVFPYPEIHEDFFALLRSWHEKAKSRKKLWTKLRLMVLHSTEVYIRLNINQSPFNVGVPIELSEFSQQQVQDFAKHNGLNWDAAQVEQLMQMVGGHPSLVQQALSHLNTHQDVTLDELLETAAQESGIYGNHLRSHLLNLQEHPELAKALKKVVTETGSVRLEPMPAYKLHSMGLVKLQGNEVKPRCNLYSQYFCERLGDT